MKVLFLDDNEKRYDRIKTEFNALLPDNPISSLTWVKTAKECIEALEREEWDLVSLDHDLGGKSNSDYGSENSGSEVVEWIVDTMPKIELIYVHSWNIPAAKRMMNKLRFYGYDVFQRPFGL